jgi:tRNA-uridine 2-sulfurtransferase
MEREFSEGVVQRFVQEYTLGRTPNPCLACNDHVKFRPLLEHAMALGADYLATDHYARIRNGERGFELWKAVDPSKDQSYVLYTLGQDELSRTLFPAGEYQKDEIREIARRWRLPNADKPDSADICFIPSGDYRSFVRERVASEPGAIIGTDGESLGAHEGIVDYTIGQRRGLPARGGGEPMFVVDIDARTNTVVAGRNEDLMAAGLVANDVRFIDGETPAGDIAVEARIRYRSEPVPTTLRMLGGGEAEVRFERPQRAVTPGQAAVFYEGDRVLGGGTISRRL